MGSEPRLRIKLQRGWTPINNPKAYICIRETSAEPGEMQFSSAVYKPGRPLPKVVTEDGLIEMCRKIMAGEVPSGREILKQSGNCDFGAFGTVALRGESPAYFQAWVLSNGRDFILITHVCPKEPDPAEITEANEIALMTRCE